MIAQGAGGAIVNIASNAGKVGYPNMAAYNASKAAVINLTRSLAQEWAEHGINVNAVCPGGVDTPMLLSVAEWITARTGRDPHMLVKEMKPRQLNRHVQPIEVGRVVAFLTTAAPTWNNWARQPSFAVSMLDLAAWLLGAQPAEESVQVGTPLEVRLDAAAYQRRVRFLPPADQSLASATIQAQPTAEGVLKAAFEATLAAGIYRVELARLEGSAETRHFAVNVDPSEGNLAHLGAPELASRLKDVKYRYVRAGGFQYEGSDAAGYDLSEAMLYGLIVLLLGEQLLAYSAGYHPRPARHAAQGGSP